MDTLENNSLKAEIKKILQLREKAEAEDNDNFSFAAPIDEGEISEWERGTGITIPKSYKEWLRFSRESTIDGTTASFWSPKKFHSRYVPYDFVVIGEMIGDGEVVAFSETNGHFISFFEGKIRREYEDFKGILNDIIELLGNPQIAPDVIEKMLEKLKGSEEGKASSHLVSFLRAYTNMTKSEITNGFNSFSVEDRRKLLSLFSNEERAKFVDKLRCQAIKNFWTHERELIENGQCTRNWSPEQIESIMNISEKTGNKKLDAGVPKVIKPNK